MLVATGDSYWGFSYKKYPYTTGWQPDYPGEGKLYGKFIAKSMPNAKIGVLYQNDSFGKNYFAGLRVGLGAKKSMVVDAESYDATQTNVTQQIIALKSKGANTLVIFAIPTQAITALVTATKIGWARDATFVGNVSANRLFMLSALQNGADLSNVYSTGYTASAVTQKTLPGVKLAAQIIDQYAPSLKQSFALGDDNIMYGFGVAWTFVNALQRAGKTPTRAGLIKALHSLNTSKNPFVYPGIKLQTKMTKKAHDNFPSEQEILTKWTGSGAEAGFQPVGKLQGGIR